MTDLSLDCSACGKKFRISFAVKPKQVACPQCKAKVNTSDESATNGVTPPANAAPLGNDVATAGATDSTNNAATSAPKPRALPDPKAPQAKPRRVHTLLKPEDVEFKGWTYDREAESARGGLQHADVMGIVWLGGVFLMVGFILFRMLKNKLVGEGFIGLGVVGLLSAGYLLLQLRGKKDGASCLRCRGALGLVHTIPTANECKAKNYTRGASGHAYRMENGQAKKIWEIHKKWHVCKACKRYFIAEKESLDFVGATRADMEKREALYAEIAAAAMLAPQPVAAAVSAPDTASAPAASAPAASAPTASAPTASAPVEANPA